MLGVAELMDAYDGLVGSSFMIYIVESMSLLGIHKDKSDCHYKSLINVTGF